MHSESAFITQMESKTGLYKPITSLKLNILSENK